MKIIANMLFGVVLFVASIWLWFKAVDYMGFQTFDVLWASFTGNGNFVPWEIDFQYVQDWVGYYWNAWIWSGIVIGFVVSISLGVLVYKLTRFTKKEKDNLRNDNAFKSLLKKGVKKSEGVFAGKYGKKEFYVSYQDRGLVVGPPGTGKTAFLINQILKAADNKVSFIAADIKPEIHSIVCNQLEQSGYEVGVINPLKDEGLCYNPLLDIKDEIRVNELVLNLLPLPLNGEPVWIQAQQWYLRLGLLYLYKSASEVCSLPEVFNLFIEHDTPDKYLDFIAESTENEVLRASALKLKSNLISSKPEQAGYGTLFENLNWLSFETTSKTLASSDLSMDEIGKRKPGAKPMAIFIQFEETRLQSLGSLMSVLYGHILNCLIDNSSMRSPVALFFDEIGNLPKIVGLAEKLHTIRSRMLPTWMYWQTITQMSKYSTKGNNGADIIMSSADLQMFFRNNAEETQKMVSTLVGTTYEDIKSVSEGKRKEVWELLDTTKTRNVTYSERMGLVIEAHQIGELKEFEAVTLYRGGKALGIGTPYFQDYKTYFSKNKAQKEL